MKLTMDCSKRVPHYDGNGNFEFFCSLDGEQVSVQGCSECAMRRDDYVDALVEALKEEPGDAVNAPAHYVGKIECIDYLRDKLTPDEFTGFCMGNVLKYCSRWRKKDGVQDLKKAAVYLNWAIENEEKRV